jgi:hypothetical protein
MPGIKVGDAVIDLFVNLASLDELESRMGVLPSKAASASTSVSGSLDGIAKSATGAGNQAAVAGEKIAAAGKVGAAGIKGADEASQSLIARMKAMEIESEQLRARVAALAEQLQSAGHRGATAFHEAQGEAALLGEITGVRLPRHVRTFLAEMPGVSTALSAAFSATAVFFLIDAVVQAAEKIEELIEKPQKIAAAWEQYDQTVFESGEHIRGEIDKEEQKLIEMTEGPVAALEFALKHLGTTAFETFKQISNDVDAAKKAMEDASSVTDFALFGNVFGEASKDLDKFKLGLQEAIRLASQNSGNNPFAPYLAAIREVELKQDELQAKIEKITKALGTSDTPAVKGLEAEKKAIGDMLPLLQQGLELEKERQKTAEQDKRVALGQQLEEQARRTLTAELAGIAQQKAADEALYAQGKINAEQLATAQIQASNSAAAAQDKYSQKIADISRAYLDATKAQGAAADASTAQIQQQTKLISEAAVAIQKAREESQKLRAEWELGVLNKQAKDSKDAVTAFDDLTKAEQRLAEAEKTLALARSTADFSRQESDIQRLAQLSVITEEEKERRLKALYERERADALQILEAQQTQELAILNKAKVNFEAASKDALFPQSELADLKRKLDEAQIAYDRTATQIVRVYEDSRKKTSGLISAERELIATQLAAAKAKQAELQQERALAAERGNDTKGIDKQIAATKQYENELQRLLNRSATVLRTKPTWDSFFSDLTSRSLRAGEAFKQMASLVADAMASSVEAAVNGSAGFGEAMAQIVKSTLASLAGAAVGHVLTEIAKASSDFATAASLAADPFTAALAPGFIASAHAHLVAAAEWGAIGAGAAVGGAAIPSGGGGGSSIAVTGSEGPAAGSTAASAAPQPVQVQNIQHFASGGFVSKRQLAVVGDSETGGDQAEVIIPLEDDSAKKRIAAAFLTAIMASQPGVTSAQRTRIISRAPALSGELANPQIFTAATRQAAARSVAFANDAKTAPGSGVHYHTYDQRTHVHVEMPIQGVISADTLDKVAPKIAAAISKKVKSGEARLTASVSHRVTKRG